MVSNTRSGRLQTVDDTNGSRSRSTGVKRRALRSSSASGSRINVRDSRNSATSRRSSMGTPTKTTISSQKLGSLRILNSPSLSFKKRSLDREAKRSMSSPIRRSQRIEKFSGSSSSGSKDYKSNKNSSPLGKNKKADQVNNSKNTSVAGASEENHSKKLGSKNSQLPKKRKRLDAKSYRALFSPKPSTVRSSDVSAMLQDDDASVGDMVNSEVAGSAAVVESSDECTIFKREELHGEHIDEETNEVEGSSSSRLREPEELNLEIDKEISSASFSLRQKSLQNGDSSRLRCSTQLLQPYSLGNAAEDSGNSLNQKENCGKGSKADAYELDKEELGKSQFEEFDSEDRPSTAEDRLENEAVSLASQSAKTTDGYDFNSSISSKNKHDIVQEVSTANNCLSSPPAIKITNMEQRNEGPQLLRQKSSIASLGGMFITELVDKEPMGWAQTDSDQGACIVCRHAGTDLCCHGKSCKRSYHLSCLDPPLKSVPPGLWLCIVCIKKKIQLGVYSVSEGIDSVWNIKEEKQSGNQYLVKYKGLAHVHNQWISEKLLLEDAPALLANFKRKYQKNKVIRWKQEWAEPHRILQKRLLMPKEIADEVLCELGNSFSKCYYEWFVKWKGLGYEDCTWEFENSPFLCTPDAMSLISGYEARHEAKRAVDSARADMALQFKKNPFRKLPSLPDGCPNGLDNDHLNSINKLREFWYKSQNAIFIDDQERVTKSILFIVSELSHACQPFLIISTSSCISFWEAEFNRLASSINLVVYNGSKDARKIIQAVEFYDEGGCIMFEVLLSHPDAVTEDIEILKCIGWEAVLVDDCHRSAVSKHFELLKNLSTDFRLLLLNGQLKDRVTEYLNLLSFLDSGNEENDTSSVKFDSTDAVGTLALLKEKLAHYVAYERKPDSSKFIEYWVPVHLSNVQLEQYCATLISNSIALRSCSKIDHVGAMKDILISIRKCCDHPYLVDELLQSRLTKDLPTSEYLDTGVHASGKLLVLDKILQAIQSQGFRVVILFQSIGGAARNSIGDILDDFLRQRFGADSYERVESGLTMSKKLAALNNFNDKAGGRFVFLIENRACLPSIRLSSVDAILLYSSDWNPSNDIRALQKIGIESNHEHLTVFRLYSVFSVEEKVLMFAKQGSVLESKLETVNPSVSHALLGWGVTYLFDQLDEFHQHEHSNNHFHTSRGKVLLENTIKDLLAKMPSNTIACSSTTCSTLIKAQQSGASYSRNIILIGEKEGISSLDKDPHSFWSSLLEGRYPQWRFISEPSHRSRRKVHNLNEFTKLVETKNEVKKKRRKVDNGYVDVNALQNWLQEKKKVAPQHLHMPDVPMGQESVGTQLEANSDGGVKHGIHNEHISPASSSGADKYMLESGGSGKLRNAQRSLHLLLKPELLKLCEILDLPENVKALAQALLEYIMTNHHVIQQSQTTIQALKISLCWRASSLLSHKLNRNESLALAKKYLDFACSEEQVYNVYSKLRILKKKFSSRKGASKIVYEPHELEPHSADIRKDVRRPVCETSSNSDFSSCHDHEQSRFGVGDDDPSSPLKFPEKELCPLKDVLFKKRIELIDKICSKRATSFLLKQQQETSELEMYNEEQELKLKKAYDEELIFIHDLVMDSDLRSEKIRLLNEEFAVKMAKFKTHMDGQLQKLKDMQLIARNKEQQIKDKWLEEAKVGNLENSFDSVPLSDSGFHVEDIDAVKDTEVPDDLRKTEYSSVIHVPSSDQQDVDMITTETLAPRGLAVKKGLAVKNTEGSLFGSSMRAESMPSDIHTSPSRPNSLEEDEGCIPRETIVEVSPTISPQEEVGIPMRTENTVSQSCPMNPASETNNTLINYGTLADIESEQQNGAGGSDISCLRLSPLQIVEQGRDAANCECLTSSSLKDRAESFHVNGTSAECETGVSLNQEPYTLEHEKPEESIGLGEHNCRSPEDIQPSRSVNVDPLQVELMNNDVTVSNSSRHELSASNELPMLGQCQASATPIAENQEDPSNMMQGSAQQIDVPLEVPVGSSSQPVGQLSSLIPCSVVHPTLSNLDTTPQRRSGEELTRSDVQLEPVHNFQLFPLVPLPHQVLQPEPLKNELTRIRMHQDNISKMHEDKKLRLKYEFDEEMEKLRKKYDTLLQDAESEFLQNKMMLETIYNKVYINQIFAEEFKAKFIENKGGKSASFQGQQQLLQTSQFQRGQRPIPTSPAPAAVGPTVPIVVAPTPLGSVRLRATSSIGAPIPSGQTSRNSSSTYQSNTVRPYFNSLIAPSANIPVGGEARAPAPHLHRFRPVPSIPSHNISIHTSGIASQQHLLANTVSATMGEVTLPASGTCQPNISSTAPGCQDTSLFPTGLPLDVGDSQVGADLVNLSPLVDIGPEFDGWLSPNLSVTAGGLPQSGLASAVADVVCISDDE